VGVGVGVGVGVSVGVGVGVGVGVCVGVWLWVGDSLFRHTSTFGHPVNELYNSAFITQHTGLRSIINNVHNIVR
jgi:hypothetical protein